MNKNLGTNCYCFHTIYRAILKTTLRPQLSTLSPETTMASGLAASAATPHRSNATYQVLIDSGPPNTLETPTPSQAAKRKRNVQTEPVAKPALQEVGRSQQASQIRNPRTRVFDPLLIRQLCYHCPQFYFERGPTTTGGETESPDSRGPLARQHCLSD